MNRFPFPIIVIAFGGMAGLLAPAAHAQSPTQIAVQENEDGKALMFERKYKEASAKFRSAANRSPDPKYYFNLCACEYQQNVLTKAASALVQAAAACRTGDKLNPDPVLKAKIAKLIEKIKGDAAAQNVDLDPSPSNTGGTPGDGSSSGDGSGGGASGDGSSGGGTGDGSGAASGGGTSDGSGAASGGGTSDGSGAASGGGSAIGNAQGGTRTPAAAPQAGHPTQDLFVAAKPEHVYTWTIGADIFGGRGQMGQDDAFGNVVGGVRLKFDYLINPASKLGSQFYFQATGFSSGDQSLQLYDTGAGLYKHFCGGTRLCFTPLAGAHFALMSPSDDSTTTRSQVFNYLGFGARLEGRLSYSLGKRLEHVISVAVDANWYSRVLSEPMDGLPARSWGLNEGGNVVSLNFGYTYRFNTPIGRVPFLSLE